MKSDIVAPLLAGIGLGYLAFHPSGKEVAAGLGKTMMPSLMGSDDSPALEDADKKDSKPDSDKNADKDDFFAKKKED